MYHGVKADSVPPFTRTPYGAHYCLGAFCSITQDSFFCATPRVAIFSAALTTDAAPPERAIWMRSRTVSDVFAILFAREEKWGTLARKSHGCSLCQERGHMQTRAAATVTRSAIQGLSKEESRELDVARRGLGSPRERDGASHCLRLSTIWDDGVGVGRPSHALHAASIQWSAGCKEMLKWLEVSLADGAHIFLLTHAT